MVSSLRSAILFFVDVVERVKKNRLRKGENLIECDEEENWLLKSHRNYMRVRVTYLKLKRVKKMRQNNNQFVSCGKVSNRNTRFAESIHYRGYDSCCYLLFLVLFICSISFSLLFCWRASQ